MSITLSDEVRELLEKQASRAGLASVEQYILEAVLAVDPEELRPVTVDAWLRRSLAGNEDPAAVPQEAVQQRWREIEAELIRGLESGPAVEVTPEFWAQRRKVLEERIGRRRQSGPA